MSVTQKEEGYCPVGEKGKYKEELVSAEHMKFKPGDVDLSDPYWKEKLEEPTNTWKNYGKRGSELPYYEGWWRPRADIFEGNF
jgi:hypothetical protein